jgi:hypothetical protein
MMHSPICEEENLSNGTAQMPVPRTALYVIFHNSGSAAEFHVPRPADTFAPYWFGLSGEEREIPRDFYLLIHVTPT